MTEGKQEGILRKVQGLLAKAASTTHEGERQVFMAKADELMEKYAIDQAMLLLKDDSKAKLVKRVDVDMSWWGALKDLDIDTRSQIYWMWVACVGHCRCYGGTFDVYSYQSKTAALYGMPADAEYVQMLFTDLFSQLVAKMRPEYDPALTMGANIAVAKAAGMKYADIAVWMGHPEWVVGGRPVDHGIMARAYKQHVSQQGEAWITTSPKTYKYSFISSFCSTITTRMRRMREQREGVNTGSMEVALRDVREQAREALWDDFPDLRPHPRDCECKACRDARKPIKGGRYRMYDGIAASAGREAGTNARIMTNDPGLRSRKSIN